MCNIFQLWASSPQEEFYIVKTKKGYTELTGKDVVCAHISNQIYRLLGVNTPDLYIGYYRDNLSLISQVLPGYKDLAEWLDGQDPLKKINHQSSLNGRIAAYKECEKKVSIQGKEALLAAAIILEDSDVIGASFRNIGLVKKCRRHHIVKIDPDESIFNFSGSETDSVLRDFKGQLSFSSPLLYKLFSIDTICNNPDSILGNLHLKEFFHNIDLRKLRNSFERFTNLKDNDIENVFFRNEYIELLNSKNAKADLKKFCNIIIGKKAFLRKFLNTVPKKVKVPVLSSVYANNLVLSEPIERMPYGASKPLKVKRITDIACTSFPSRRYA